MVKKTEQLKDKSRPEEKLELMEVQYVKRVLWIANERKELMDLMKSVAICRFNGNYY
jgi:hypothetical protein